MQQIMDSLKNPDVRERLQREELDAREEDRQLAKHRMQRTKPPKGPRVNIAVRHAVSHVCVQMGRGR